MEKKDDYEQLEFLGSGRYCKCYKIIRKRDRKIFAWKVVRLGSTMPKELTGIKNEILTIGKIENKNIVKYCGTIIEARELDSHVYLIMEYCDKGSIEMLIDEYKKKQEYISEKFIWDASRQIVSGLMECHTRKLADTTIVHRALKAANILLTNDGCFKIAYFGCSRHLDKHRRARTSIGTQLYMAPEILTHELYSEKCDIWSLGCVLYELCTLVPPFVDAEYSRLREKIINDPAPDIPDKYSSDLRNMIGAMLTKEPCFRPSASDLDLFLTRVRVGNVGFQTGKDCKA